MPSTERGRNWEWSDIHLSTLEFEKWRTVSTGLASSIRDVCEERGGWKCVADGGTYVIGIHRGEERILVMREIRKE
jgi:hypothetical protein